MPKITIFNHYHNALSFGTYVPKPSPSQRSIHGTAFQGSPGDGLRALRRGLAPPEPGARARLAK